MLNVGNFDERIFLGEHADVEIGTPARISHDLQIRHSYHDVANRSLMQQHFQEVHPLHSHNTPPFLTCSNSLARFLQTRTLFPPTPLTGRNRLKENDVPVTPVSTATQSVSRLQGLLAGRKSSPSDKLIAIVE